jgi:hypothetical protein
MRSLYDSRSRLKFDLSPLRFVQDDIDREMGTIASCAGPSEVGLNRVKSGEMLRAERLLGFAIKEHAMLRGRGIPASVRVEATEDADQSPDWLITIR